MDVRRPGAGEVLIRVPASSVNAVERVGAHVTAFAPGERVWAVRAGATGIKQTTGLTSIAAALGAHVVGLASSRNAELVRSLGADEFFDYSLATPSTVGPVDVLFDTVGTDSAAWRRRPTGRARMLTIAFNSPRALAAIGLSTVHGSRRIRAFAGEPPPAISPH